MTKVKLVLATSISILTVALFPSMSVAKAGSADLQRLKTSVSPKALRNNKTTDVRAQELSLWKYDQSVEGVYAVSSPAGDSDFVAVRFSLPASIDSPFTISRIRFYNNDGNTVWPKILVTAGDDVLPILDVPILALENVATGDTGFVDLPTDVQVADRGDFFIVIQFPPGASLVGAGNGGGPGIGIDENLNLGEIAGSLFSTDGINFTEIAEANLALEVTIGGPERTDDHEPNDSVALATPVAEGQTIAGYLGSPGDLDIYTFMAGEDTFVDIDLDASVLGSALDGYMTLLNEAGEIIRENDDEITSLRTDPSIEFIAPATGKYFLVLDSFEHHNDGTQISGIDLFYEVKFNTFLERPRQTHQTDDVEFSVWSNGIYGDDGTGLGAGFAFNSNPGRSLFAGGFLAATPTSIAANIPSYGLAGNQRLIDFEAAENFLPFVADGRFDQITTCRFEESEQNAFNEPAGLSVEQTSYSIAANPVIFVECNITNVTNGVISDLYFGQFADWDVGPENPDDNRGGYDAASRLVYQFEAGDNPVDSNYYGIMALQAVAGARVTTTVTRDSIFDFISNLDGVRPAPAEEMRDYQSFLGSGPFELPAGGSTKVVFAWLAANSLNDLKSLAAEAVDIWEGKVAGIMSDLARPAEFILRQNYPNPFNPATRIGYFVPEPGHAQLTIFNTRGQRIRILVDRHASAGWHDAFWDGRDGGGALMPSGVYLYKLESPGMTPNVKKMLMVR
jgi:hypothetical protein